MRAAQMLEYAQAAADAGDWDDAAEWSKAAGERALDEGDELTWETSRRLSTSLATLRMVRLVIRSRGAREIRASQLSLWGAA